VVSHRLDYFLCAQAGDLSPICCDLPHPRIGAKIGIKGSSVYLDSDVCRFWASFLLCLCMSCNFMSCIFMSCIFSAPSHVPMAHGVKNAGVGDRDRAAEKAPEGMTDRQTHRQTHTTRPLCDDYYYCIVITRVCWFAGSFFVLYDHCNFSKTTSPIFMKFGTDVQYHRSKTLLTFESSRSSWRSKTAYWKSSNFVNLGVTAGYLPVDYLTSHFWVNPWRCPDHTHRRC